MRTPIRARLSALALLGGLLPAILLPPGYSWAQIVADPSAPGSRQPPVTSTANGVPLVYIQTPNASGLSRNVYSQFDVGKPGAILNNSPGNVQTQQGGWVPGNANLAGGPARTILNEVNSNAPSVIKGFVEVAGARADVIIANPSGIVVNGGGFINAGGVTLSTGSASFDAASGALRSHIVSNGTVVIEGAGLDTRGADYTVILARATQINAGLWAKDTRVALGRNEIIAALPGKGLTVTPLAAEVAQSATTPPRFALDVAAQGGMYAGQIYLIGTEAGLGVNLRGVAGASAGDVLMLADGTITNAGHVQARDRVAMRSQSGDINNSGTVAGASVALKADNVTNRGVVDGNTTRITATRQLDNLGGGRIYGDHVALQADQLNNLAETDASGQVMAPVIAARERMDIAVGDLVNQNHASIISAGGLYIGGQLDAQGDSQARARSVRNGSALIDALGDLSISADRLVNSNDHFEYEQRLVDTRYSVFERLSDRYYRSFNRYVTAPVVTQDDPAQISAAGKLTLNAGQIDNIQSRVLAGGDLVVNGTTINNVAITDKQTTHDVGTQWSWGVTGGHDACYPCKWVNDWGMVPSSYDSSARVTVTVATGVSVPRVGTSTPAAALQTTLARSVAGVGSVPGSVPGASAGIGSQRPPSSALFRAPAQPGATYLIETDPRFTHFKTWMSSDYMLNALAVDPTTVQKRLGDGYYEQRLLREQIASLTGRRFLDGHSSDTDEYRALMDQGVTVARQLQLRPGVALSAEQAARLTSDMVWLVEQAVTLPDGTTTSALVPQLYLAVRPNDLQPDGRLYAAQTAGGVMSGNNVLLQANGGVINSGTLVAGQRIDLRANDFANQGGQVRAQQLSLVAKQDISNSGGTLAATQQLSLQAGRDVNVVTETRTDGAAASADSAARARASSSGRTYTQRVATVYVGGPPGGGPGSPGSPGNKAGTSGTLPQLQISAGRDVRLTAADLNSAGQTTLVAGRDLTLGAITTGETFHRESQGEAEFRQHIEKYETTGTHINSAGTLVVAAGNNLTGTAAQLSSGANAALVAGNSITLAEGRNTHNDDLRWKETSHDFLSSTETKVHIHHERDVATGNSVTAQNGLSVTAGRSVAVRAGELKAGQGGHGVQGDLNIAAQDVYITSGLNLNKSSVEVETRTSGLTLGQIMGIHKPGEGIGYEGNRAESDGSTTLAPSQLQGAKVNIKAGEQAGPGNSVAPGSITLAAVDVQAGVRTDGPPQSPTPGQITLNAGADGTVNLNTVKTTELQAISRKEGDLIWQSQSGSGQQKETAQNNRLSGELKVAAAQVHVQVGVKAGDGAELTPPPGLQATARQLAQQPGLEWMGQIQSDPALSQKINWAQVDEAYKTWQYDKAGLTQAGAAVLAIIVSMVATPAAGNAARAATAAGANVATAAAVQAGVQTLMAQAAVAFVNNKGDIGKTLEQLGSQGSVNTLLVAVLTAGAVQAMSPPGTTTTVTGQSGPAAEPLRTSTSTTSATSTGTALNSATWVDTFNTQLRNNVASSLIDAGIRGKPLDEKLLASALKSAILNTIAQGGSQTIGDLATPDVLKGKEAVIDQYTQAMAHAVLGCAVGSAKADGGCSAGAVGALVGELSAQFGVEALGLSKEQALKLAGITSAVSGLLVGGPNDAGAVNIANSAGDNAARNNYLNHIPSKVPQLSEKQKYEAAVTACASGDATPCATKTELAALSAKRDADLREACSDPQSSACKTLTAQAQGMGNIVRTTPEGLVYANSPDKGAIRYLNNQFVGPVNDRPENFQDQVARSTAEGLLLETGNQALAGLTVLAGKGVAMTSETVKGYFASRGLTLTDDVARTIAGDLSTGNNAASIGGLPLPGGTATNGGRNVALEGAGFDTTNLQSKLEGYLLDPTHPQNQTKAAWFQQALGFDKTNWRQLGMQITFNESTAVATKTTQYGQTFEQVIPITGVNGKTIDVPFVFMKDNTGTVRLVTGIPAKK